MTSKTRLAENSLGLAESVVMGVAGTAPAFSAAATTATLIAAVGVLSPASLLYCGLIMFGVTLAFRQLNRVDPNAGASYAWVDKAFGPVLGFLAGWSLLVATALFMVSGTVPAAPVYAKVCPLPAAMFACRFCCASRNSFCQPFSMVFTWL